MTLLKNITDSEKKNSLATTLRRKRFALFQTLLRRTEKPLRILDIGGYQVFWETMEFPIDTPIEVVLLNRSRESTSLPNFTSLVGDARHMGQFQNQEFDVVFSNSVIEHVGSYENQRKMAAEVKRVGKRYFIQTPNRYFPVEPHFLFPFFQFLPITIRVWLLAHFNVGWVQKKDYDAAKRVVENIRLLNQSEFVTLFPEAHLYKEKFLGLTKSFTAYYGWD